MSARLRYVREVLGHAGRFAGWLAGLVTLLFGGSIIGGAAWLVNTHHRTLAVALLAAGVMLAFVEGSYRLWVSVSASLTTAKPRMSELDLPEAKRSYLDGQLDRARRLRREFEDAAGPTDAQVPHRWQESEGVEDLLGDLEHWEDEVRAELKDAFSPETARLFSNNAVEPQSPDGDGSVHLSCANTLAHLDRRIARLREIRGTI